MTSSTLYRWNPLPDSGCQPSSSNGRVPNDDVERKFQYLESSVHKTGMLLDSVQNDVIGLNRARKDAKLDSDCIQQKAVVLENSVQKIFNGQDDLKAFIERSTKSNPDKLNVGNSHSSQLDEISLSVSVWPRQIESDLRLLQSGISSVLTEEMQPSCIFSLPCNCGRSKLMVEQGKVKGVPQNFTGCSCSLPPEHEEMLNRHVTQRLTTEKVKEPVYMIIDSDDDSEGRVSSVILKTETGVINIITLPCVDFSADVESHLMNEAAEESLKILKRARKRRGELEAIVPAEERAASESARTSDETGSKLLRRTSDRDRYLSTRFHGPDWYR